MALERSIELSAAHVAASDPTQITLCDSRTTLPYSWRHPPTSGSTTGTAEAAIVEVGGWRGITREGERAAAGKGGGRRKPSLLSESGPSHSYLNAHSRQARTTVGRQTKQSKKLPPNGTPPRCLEPSHLLKAEVFAINVQGAW